MLDGSTFLCYFPGRVLGQEFIHSTSAGDSLLFWREAGDEIFTVCPGVLFHLDKEKLSFLRETREAVQYFVRAVWVGF